MFTTVECGVTIPIQNEFSQSRNVFFCWRKWNILRRFWSLNSLGTVATFGLVGVHQVTLVKTVEIFGGPDLWEVLTDDTEVPAGCFGEE